MTTSQRSLDIIANEQSALFQAWIADLQSSGRSGDNRTSAREVEEQARGLLQAIVAAIGQRVDTDTQSPAWEGVRAFLRSWSAHRVAQGFTSGQTAAFVFSLKKPLFELLRGRLMATPELLVEEIWVWTQIIDGLGLFTVQAFQESREGVIKRQQEDLLELSTPVIKLWDGILALPMIGTLDSARTQVVMETLLQRMLEAGSEIAILDITGVPTVDTLVAQHLMKTVSAIRLMGADCIISGIRPQIAQTIVHLGIDLSGITTKATLADALALALSRSGLGITRHAGSH